MCNRSKALSVVQKILAGAARRDALKVALFGQLAPELPPSPGFGTAAKGPPHALALLDEAEFLFNFVHAYPGETSGSSSTHVTTRRRRFP